MGRLKLSVILVLLFSITLTSAFNFETGGVKIVEPIESNGAIPINIQDQTTPPIDFFFNQINGAPTTVAVNVSVDDLTINLTDATNCDTDDYFGVFNSDDPNNNRASFATVLSKTGNQLTLDTPMDFEYLVGDTAACFSRNLAVDGSLATQTFSVQIGPNADQCIDVTRLMFSLITDSAVGLNLFGDLPELTNGIVIRRVNDETRNFWNIKNNGDIANLCFDYQPYQSINPAQGQDGAKFRCTFAGQEKHGVAVRLCPGDALQVLIQDDLSGLQQFRVIAEGHYVTD